MKNSERLADLSRRTFLKGGSFSTLMSMLGGVQIIAQEKPKSEGLDAKPIGRIVKCAVIGLGPWGREILATLGRFQEAQIVAICDTYAPMLERGKRSAPNAVATDDYRTILNNKEVEAVFIATPTYLHRDICVASLQAGKHVYCEAPLSNTIEDARTIAKAAKEAFKVVFQPGLQTRSHPQRHFLLQFIRAGAMGKTVMVRAQWHRKQSWYFTSPNPAREKEINWRLSRKTAAGLMGEIGVHQVDVATWFLDAKPVAVTGFGSYIDSKEDKRDVPNTIQAVFEYPAGINLIYDATLANSFESDYEVYYGTDSAVMVRDNKAWMFKEVDAPLLGWEVYARKDSFYKETGIALVANASKLEGQGDSAAADANSASTALLNALESFLGNAGKISSAVEDFTKNFGNDPAALKEYLDDVNKARLPAAGYREGYESAVIAIKANEAILEKKRIAFPKEWFDLG